MNQEHQTRAYAALGLAGQMGCLITILVLGALFAGIWIDRTFNTHKIAILVCVAASVPVTLFLSITLTQRLIKRIIPPDKPVTRVIPPGEQDN
ncbi:MAG: AtpZ/AtpI family protein [Chloroflexota bacterium]